MAVEVNGILVAAHELKAPLCLIRQLALNLEQNPSPAQSARLQSQLVAVSDRALKQVNDLAKIARLEDGLFALEPVGVRGVCEAVYQELRPLFRAEGRYLQLSYRNQPRVAIANRDLLQGIIYNFCVNALHYSDPDSVSRLTVSSHRNRIRIDVRDYGPALPSSVWQALREDRLDQPITIAMRPGSSGLGLYIASRFAHHIHARLGATRHHDGTSFFVEVPVSRQLDLPI